MVKIQLVSDVHGRWEKLRAHPGAHLVVAAGDMADGLGAVERLAELGKPVVYVPGNHEYYGGDLGDRVDELKARAVGSKVVVADRQTVVAGDVRLLCATLWTDYANLDPVLLESGAKALNDYRKISVKKWLAQPVNKAAYSAALAEFEARSAQNKGLFQPAPEKMNPLVGLVLHREALGYLHAELSKPWKGKTLVVTHHAPSMHSLTLSGFFTTPAPDVFAKHLSRKSRPHKIGAYANSLEYLFANNSIELWLHGHLHQGLRYTVDGVGVLTNPAGYNDQQNPRFAADLLIASEDESRPIKLLCLTLYQCLPLQAEMRALLRQCVVDDALARKLFPSRGHFRLFASIYNEAIGPLLRQPAKDRSRAQFILEPLDLNRFATQAGPADSSQRLLHAFLAQVTDNERRAKEWLAALQGRPELSKWTVEGPL